jgi:hypothetical protein
MPCLIERRLQVVCAMAVDSVVAVPRRLPNRYGKPRQVSCSRPQFAGAFSGKTRQHPQNVQHPSVSVSDVIVSSGGCWSSAHPHRLQEEFTHGRLKWLIRDVLDSLLDDTITAPRVAIICTGLLGDFDCPEIGSGQATQHGLMTFQDL